jgi:hypothetical protein
MAYSSSWARTKPRDAAEALRSADRTHRKGLGAMVTIAALTAMGIVGLAVSLHGGDPPLRSGDGYVLFVLALFGATLAASAAHNFADSRYYRSEHDRLLAEAKTP